MKTKYLLKFAAALLLLSALNPRKFNRFRTAILD